MRAFDRNSGRELAGRVTVARTPWSRARGLLGRKELLPGEGLLITPCLGVHTFLMRFPIDVVFLDQDSRIIATVENLKPHRMTRIFPGSRGALELPAGTVSAALSAAGNEVVLA